MIWEATLKKLTDMTAFNAALRWVDKPVNLKLVNNQINCVYRFESNRQGYYLRITHENIRPLSDLRAAIDFQQHLFRSDAPVCEAIASKSKLLVESVSQDDLTFFTHVCREVPGKEMSFDHTDKNAYINWGRALALLHKASQNYQAKEHRFKTWRDLWQETWDYAKREEHLIQELYQAIDASFHELPANTHNYGLTHGDHRPGNVLYDGQRTHIIDFDEPVYHWYMADIAKPFLDLCNQPRVSWQQKFSWYIEGYSQILPILESELKSINNFTQMKSLDIYLWCKYNWFEETAPGGKPRELWLTELRQMALTPLFQ